MLLPVYQYCPLDRYMHHLAPVCWHYESRTSIKQYGPHRSFFLPYHARLSFLSITVCPCCFIIGNFIRTYVLLPRSIFDLSCASLPIIIALIQLRLFILLAFPSPSSLSTWSKLSISALCLPVIVPCHGCDHRYSLHMITATRVFDATLLSLPLRCFCYFHHHDMTIFEILTCRLPITAKVANRLRW